MAIVGADHQRVLAHAALDQIRHVVAGCSADRWRATAGIVKFRSRLATIVWPVGRNTSRQLVGTRPCDPQAISDKWQRHAITKSCQHPTHDADESMPFFRIDSRDWMHIRNTHSTDKGIRKRTPAKNCSLSKI
jgi:hypothetical protein